MRIVNGLRSDAPAFNVLVQEQVQRTETRCIAPISNIGTYIATSNKIMHPLCLTLIFAYATM